MNAMCYGLCASKLSSDWIAMDILFHKYKAILNIWHEWLLNTKDSKQVGWNDMKCGSVELYSCIVWYI